MRRVIMGRSAAGAGVWMAFAGVIGGGFIVLASCSSSSATPPNLGDTNGDGGDHQTTNDATMVSQQGGNDAAAVEEPAPVMTPSDSGYVPCGDGGQRICPGANLCVDIQTDPKNCGGCSQPCLPQQTCVAGACQCGLTQTLCGSQCVTTATDVANCGSCGHNCQGGGCMNSLCQASLVTTASPGYNIDGIAVTSTSVWWTSPNNGTTSANYGQVGTHALAGSTPYTPILNQNGAAAITADQNSIYWVNDSGSVSVVTLLSGAGYTWAAGDAGSSLVRTPVAIAVNSHYVFWVDSGLGTVNQASINGGAPILVLAQGRVLPNAVAADENNVYWVDYGSTNSGSVNMVPVGGGGITALVTGENEPWDIKVDATNVYWITHTNPGFVKSIPISGAPATPTVLAMNQGSPYGIALDPPSGTTSGQFVYWTDFDDRTVNKVPVGGGVVYQLATNQDNPASIATDAKNVYWVNQGGADIWKIAK